jgi:aminoglycoside phosphotransferase (APT) family kinase protein
MAQDSTGSKPGNDDQDREGTGERISGYHRPRVEAWMVDNIDGLTGRFEWSQLEGGHSNLTFLVADGAGRRVVVRRPPEGELLPKAHDMKREFTIISGLAKTDMPVAEPLALCEDTSITGAVFYVMSEVGGRALYTAEDVDDWLTMEARDAVGYSFISTLARLHSIDPADIGLDQLARHDGYVSRQLRTWYGSWQASIDGADYDDARIHQFHDELVATIPEQGPARVVHGDYGMHNCMIDRSGSVAAVLDWEIATLGDPLADFAYALNGWSDPDDEIRVSHEAATIAPGFPRRQALAEHYADLTGCDLSNLGFYRTFNYFKTACILHGVYARYMLGQKSTEGIDLDGLKERMVGSIDLAEAEFAR